MIERRFVVRDMNHDAGHYAALGFKTILGYVVFIASLFSIPALQWFGAQIAQGQVDRAVIGETAITIEVSETETERVRGLAGRESIPKNHGMLFIFPESDYHAIWMKGMLFSLDVVWLNRHSEVVHIEKNISPNTFPKSFRPSKQSRYIIEFNAGFTTKNSVKVGDRFILP